MQCIGAAAKCLLLSSLLPLHLISLVAVLGTFRSREQSVFSISDDTGCCHFQLNDYVRNGHGISTSLYHASGSRPSVSFSSRSTRLRALYISSERIHALLWHHACQGLHAFILFSGPVRRYRQLSLVPGQRVAVVDIQYRPVAAAHAPV